MSIKLRGSICNIPDSNSYSMEKLSLVAAVEKKPVDSKKMLIKDI